MQPFKIELLHSATIFFLVRNFKQAMTAFVLLIAILDVFAGEFGSLGTPIVLLAVALVCGGTGWVRGVGLWITLYDAIIYERRKLQVSLVLCCMTFALVDLSVGALSISGVLAPDHPVVIAVGVLLLLLPKANRFAVNGGKGAGHAATSGATLK